MEVKGNFIVQGSYIDIHDNEVVNLSVDKGQVQINGKDIRTNESAETPTESLLVCIEKLMDEKDTDGEYIFNQGNHWIAIFRIIVDKGLGVSGNDYKGFCEMISNLKPSGFRVPLKHENLRKITEGIYCRPFGKWNYAPEYNTTRAPYDKMVKIATRFKEILEENGF